jgi:hypothetical protein
MSEERLERIENQITVLSELVQQNIASTDRRFTVLSELVQQNIASTDRRFTQLENRVDSLEGTLLTAMTEGFASLHDYQIDLDRDLAINEQRTEDNARKSRRLNQRLMRLEQRYDEF